MAAVTARVFIEDAESDYKEIGTIDWDRDSGVWDFDVDHELLSGELTEVHEAGVLPYHAPVERGDMILEVSGEVKPDSPLFLDALNDYLLENSSWFAGVELAEKQGDDLVKVYRKAGPPGPPPRSGLEWKEETKRWIRPETGEEYASVDPDDDLKDVDAESLPDKIMTHAVTRPILRISDRSRTKFRGMDVQIVGTKATKSGRKRYEIIATKGYEVRQGFVSPSEIEIAEHRGQEIKVVRTEDDFQDLMAENYANSYVRTITHGLHPDYQVKEKIGDASRWGSWDVLEITRKRREGEALNDKEEAIVQAVFDVAKPLSADEIVWRGTRDTREFSPGQRFPMKHHESTSRTVEIAFNYSGAYPEEDGLHETVFQVLVPKGTPALVYNDYLSEVVLLEGTELEVMDVQEEFQVLGRDPIKFVTLKVVG